MKHAFDKAGFDRLRFELKAVAPRFTREDWIAIHDEATQGMLGEGQLSIADGQNFDADAQPPIPEGHQSSAESHTVRADRNAIAGEAKISQPQGPTSGASSCDPIASAEAKNVAPPAIPAVPPAREPSEAFRRALTRDRIQTTAIWLEINKTSDGRPWAKVCPYEFDGMERDARIVHHIRFTYGAFNQKQLNTPLGKLMTPDLQRKLASRVDLMESRRAG